MSFLYRFTSFRVPLFVVTCDLHDLTHSHAKPTTINSHVALFLLSSSKPLQQPFSIRSHSRTYQPTSTYQPTLHHGESERERERERAPNNKRDTQITRSPLTTTMNNANTAASANAEEAALYDANITITALRQQLFVSEAATLRSQQLAQDLADEAEHRWGTEIAPKRASPPAARRAPRG
jgi:hypothetical protein